MTNDLEITFFDTFGIPKIYKTTINIGDLDYNPVDITAPTLKKLHEEAQIDFAIPFEFKEFKNNTALWEHDYPQITDRILLELICIDFNENPYKCRGGQTSVDEVKERILSDFIHEFENDLYLDKEKIKHQVRTLFEEG
jgi:hypothetical protein